MHQRLLLATDLPLDHLHMIAQRSHLLMTPPRLLPVMITHPSLPHTILPRSLLLMMLLRLPLATTTHPSHLLTIHLRSHLVTDLLLDHPLTIAQRSPLPMTLPRLLPAM